MAIIRHTTRMPVFTAPWRELDDLLTSRLGRFTDDSWTGISQAPGGDWAPAVNVDESKDELVLTAELPGLTEENVEIELEDNILTIRGEKLEESREDDSRVHLFERRYGAFLRSTDRPAPARALALVEEYFIFNTEFNQVFLYHPAIADIVHYLFRKPNFAHTMTRG